MGIGNLSGPVNVALKHVKAVDTDEQAAANATNKCHSWTKTFGVRDISTVRDAREDLTGAVADVNLCFSHYEAEKATALAAKKQLLKVEKAMKHTETTKIGIFMSVRAWYIHIAALGQVNIAHWQLVAARNALIANYSGPEMIDLNPEALANAVAEDATIKLSHSRLIAAAMATASIKYASREGEEDSRWT